MNSLKISVFALLCSMVTAFSPIVCHGSEHDDALRFAEEIRTLIINYDVSEIENHLQSGFYVSNTALLKDDIIRMLHDTNSWLYRNLFANNDSVRSHLIESKSLEIHVQQEKDYFIISYVNPENTTALQPSVTIKLNNGTWLFSDLFFN
ncbi:MAG: hypothetical protein ACLGSA_12285 [Acidobacteriota bacterium]